MDFKVIAISGWKRSGKDSMADILKKEHNAIRVSFADPLKDLVAAEYGILRDSLDNPEYKEKPILSMPIEPKDEFTKTIVKFMEKEFKAEDGSPCVWYSFKENGGWVKKSVVHLVIEKVYWTPRALAILKGSTNRAVSSNYWVKRACDHIMSKAKDGDLFVIPDLRYKSEISQLKEFFKESLVIVRINRFDTIQSQDPSENDLNDYEFSNIIENRGSFEDFNKNVKNFMRNLRAINDVISAEKEKSPDSSSSEEELAGDCFR